MRQRQIKLGKIRFLSTLSLRRATRAESGQQRSPHNFYPRSPCGERRNGHPDTHQRGAISIHALLAESDRKGQSSRAGIGISIHALLAESDIMFTGILAHHAHFYPRSPCGERPWASVIACSRYYFYPRSPCGERLCGGSLCA